MSAPLLRVDRLVAEHGGRHGRVRAVADVSFEVGEGEALGIVGESGSGKSTLARAVVQLHRPTSGSVWFRGVDLTGLRGRALRRARADLQMVFQDPISSLNPRRTVREIVAEGLRHRPDGGGPGAATAVDELLDAVALEPELRDRRPHELSGGQCQRVSIARALVVRPTLLVCDEPVSALDVSVQAQILNQLDDARTQRNLGLVVISHDLAVVRNASDRVLVMYLGTVCEVADSDHLFAAAAHPYTRALLAAVPGSGLDDADLGGETPSSAESPAGCPFHTRCPSATERCRTERPGLREVASGHLLACHHPVAQPVALTRRPGAGAARAG